MKSIIDSCKSLSFKDREKKLRNVKLPTVFKEEFTFFMRPGSNIDLDFLVSANRNTQNDYLQYMLEEPLAMVDRLKNRLKTSNSIVAKLLLSRRVDTSECNFIGISSDGRLTFHPKPWLQTFNDDGTYKVEGRQIVSLAKLLRRLGLISKRSTKLLAPHIEQLTHALTNEFEIKETSFKEAYSWPRAGWVCASCMLGKPVEHMYGGLGAVPMILYQDGEVAGRFLKWELPEGTYYDRLYYKSEPVLNWFKQYCKDKGIPEWTGKKGQKLVVKEHFDMDEYIPYMDTFKYYSPDLKTFFSNYDDMGVAKDALYYILENQEGSYAPQNKGRRICAITGKVFELNQLTKVSKGEHAGRYINSSYETKS